MPTIIIEIIHMHWKTVGNEPDKAKQTIELNGGKKTN